MVDSLNTLARSRAEACELWADLEPLRFEDQYYLVRTHRRFLAWGFCELMCEESLRLASVDAARAVERAELGEGCGRGLWHEDAKVRDES